MKTIIHSELTDQQRNTLAQLLDQKPTTRLATRAEVQAFALGALDAATIEEPRIALAAVQHLPPAPPELLARARRSGNAVSYINGYNQVAQRHGGQVYQRPAQ